MTAEELELIILRVRDLIYKSNGGRHTEAWRALDQIAIELRAKERSAEQ